MKSKPAEPMSESFDPLHEWLGIPPAEQPPDHYRLLGVTQFEDDAEIINTAADRQMNYLRQFQTGPRAEHTQTLLNKITAAKICLLEPDTKATYDAVLKGKAAVYGVKVQEPPMASAAPQLPSSPEMPLSAPPVPGATGRVTEPTMTSGPAVPASSGRVTEPSMTPASPPTQSPGRVTEPTMSGSGEAQMPPMTIGPPGVPGQVSEPTMRAGQQLAGPGPAATPSPNPVENRQVRPTPRGPTPQTDSRSQMAAQPAPSTMMPPSGGYGVSRTAAPPPASPPPAAPTQQRQTTPTVATESSAVSRVRDRQSDSALHKQPWFAVTVAIGSLAAIAIVVLIAAFATKKGEPKKKDKGDEPKTIAEQPTATAIMQAGDGVVTLSASRANVVRGASRQSQGGTALSFRGAGDEVRWELKLHRPAIFQVEVEYASAAESGGRMLLEVSGATRGARIRGTSGINNFRNTKVGHLTIRKSGQHTLVFKTTELPGGQQLLVRAVRLTPTGLGGG